MPVPVIWLIRLVVDDTDPYSHDGWHTVVGWRETKAEAEDRAERLNGCATLAYFYEVKEMSRDEELG